LKTLSSWLGSIPKNIAIVVTILLITVLPLVLLWHFTIAYPKKNQGQAGLRQAYRIRSITQIILGHSDYRPEQRNNRPRYAELL